MPHQGKIFGIGIQKTGTTTLGHALEILGYRHAGHDLARTLGFLDGDRRLVDAALANHDSFEDWPWPLMYRELFARYGRQARYVLTRRDTPERWLDSVRGHALRANPDVKIRERIYGHLYPHGAEDVYRAFYTRHLSEVTAFFDAMRAPDVLLSVCWESGDGWPELCAFLGHSVPNVPFPVSNRAAEADTRVPPDRISDNERRAEQQRAQLSKA